MSNWAVVIGVDRYAAPSLNLKGAVRDALHMVEFLTHGEVPLVEPARVKLLVSRTAESPEPPASVPAMEASLENIVEAFRDVAKKPPGRLFVHFSGHGLMAPGLTGGEAILPADYKPDLPMFSIRFEGIRDFLRTSKFDEQIFFIDACRNTPMPENFNVGQFPITPKPQDMRPQVQQFVFCATLRGVTANEDRRTKNDERGVFTEPLLRGLRGEGRAKIYDEGQQAYLVTAGRLLRYVRDEVRKTVAELEIPAPPDAQGLQEPRLTGEMGDTEMVLVTLPPAQMSPVRLSFDVIPPAAADSLKVIVRGSDGDLEVGPPISATTIVALPPRDYRVLAFANEFTPVKKSWHADLYEHTQLRLEMAPRERALDLDFTRARESPFRVEAASLEFRSTDPLTIVRIIDRRGQVIASGKETVRISAIEPGIYRGQLISSDGALIERIITVEQGPESVTVEAPAAPVSLSANLSAPASVQTPIVDVMAVEDTLCRIVNAEVRPLETGGAPIAVTPAFLPTPGHYRVSFSIDSSRVSVALPALREWDTTLLIELRTQRTMSSTVQFVKPDGSNVDELDQLETAQRYFQNGFFEAALELSTGHTANPIAAVIEAYSLLRLSSMATERRSKAQAAEIRERLGERVHRLDADFPDLSDSKLLLAEVMLLTKLDPTSQCLAALDRGLPLMAFGSMRLMGHVRSLAIQHRRRNVLEVATTKRVTGWLWTAWLDDEPAAN